MITVDMPKQVIVLGGGLTAEGYPTQETAERTFTAVRYAQQFGADEIIFSGGQGLLSRGNGATIAEAEVMAELATEYGLEPGSIRALDKDSRSTFETFLNVKPLLLDQKTAIVTHAYHQPRALYMARLALTVPIIGYEAMGVHTGKAKSPLNERFLQIATWATMHSVQPGDVAALRERNDRIVSIVSTPRRINLLAKTLLRDHTSVKAVKAEAIEKHSDTTQ